MCIRDRYGERPVTALMNKIYSREDCFEIGKCVKIENSCDEVKDEILKYEGVVICDLPAAMRNDCLLYTSRCV